MFFVEVLFYLRCIEFTYIWLKPVNFTENLEMSKRLPLILLLLFCSIGFSIAQSFTVEGQINEAGTGLPLIGVNILIQNTSNGTVTDIDGTFILEDVPQGSVLMISYTGYASLEITVNDDSFLDLEMSEDAQALDEVVVIGYSTAKKRELTGAVSTLNSKTIENIRPTRVEQALQGTVSGVNVTTQSGSPGAGLDIRIRGISTNGQNAPTVIIDGYIGELGLLNPNDIESITVLKDAQAAIYGTIGANGIILVTTKSGRKNTKPTVTYDGFFTLQQTSRKLPVLNATEYALLLNESYAANGDPLPFPNVNGLGQGIDWQDEVFETSPQFNHNLSLSGGTDNVTYSLGVSNVNQEGIVGPEKSNFDRNTARLNLGIDVTDFFKINTAFIYNQFSRQTLAENALGSVLFNAINYAPTFGINQEDTLGIFGAEVINPLSQIENTFNEFSANRLSGTISGELTYLENFKFTARIGFNTANQESRNFSPIANFGSGKVFNTDRSRVSLSRENFNDYTFDLFNNYNRSFGAGHNVTWTLGMTVFRTFGDGLSGSRLDVQNNAFEFADFSTALGIGEDASNGSFGFDERRLSYFTQVQYDFNQKYLVSLMLRRDGSSRFGPTNRVAYFPSVTAGWAPIQDQVGKLNFLKVRASYGVLGNDQIGNNLFLGQLNGEATYVLGNALTQGVAIGALPNPDLQWEEARKFDVGVDVNLFSNSVSITTDYFINNRENLLIPSTPVTGIAGTAAPGGASPTINAGSVRNQGFEFAIRYDKQLSSDVRFTVAYNLTTLTNEVTAINGADFLEGGGFSVGQPPPARMEVGQPIGYFYGFVTDGLFQTPEELDPDNRPSQAALGAEPGLGDIRFVDINGDGVIDFDDRTNIGDPIPDLTMGLNLNFQYKNFDVIAYAFASIGNDIVRNYERNQINVNRPAFQLDRWTGPGTSTSVPRVTTGATSNGVFSDFFVEDGSYLRLQNIQIGYTLPQSVLERLRLNSLRVYIGSNNLFTLTEYSGFDPGASSGAPIGGGIDNGFYPIPRSFLFGINLNL